MPKSIDQTPSIGAIVAELSRMFRRNFNARVRHHGLTQPQWQALAALVRREGMKQAELAELLEIQPISVARLIDRMEAAGWVERRPDPHDRRALQLFLTAKAEPILDEMAAASTTLREEAFVGFSKAEREQLFTLLERLKSNLRDCECSPQTASPDHRENTGP